MDNYTKKDDMMNDKHYRGDMNSMDDKSKMDMGGRMTAADKKRVYMKRKICRFCADKGLKIDYKDYDILRRFTTDGGKIIPRRMSGNCAKHQRILANAIKQARFMALLPYVKK